MKMYYANNGNLKIEEREVVRQTTSSVFIERTSSVRLGDRREAKRSEWGAWFEYHEMAKNHLVALANARVNAATISLEKAIDGLNKAKEL